MTRTPAEIGWGLSLLALSAAACVQDTSPSDPAPPRQHEGWQDQLEMVAPTDLDPSPQVVEIQLESRVEAIELLPGTTTPAWTYGGTVPGPLIRARVGDRLIVHFTNRLPEPTTIHWHGLRVPNAMDGVPGVTQDAIAPGETFVYDFLLPDAGTFWYHPHVNSAAQLGRGLYGALVVEDPAEPHLGDELVVVLSDMSLDDDGQFEPLDSGGELGDLFGREGKVLLVNGRVDPLLRARPGLRQRWRVINAARSRYFTLGFEGHTFTQIGGDGGLASSPVESPTPVLVPGERADLLVVPTGAPGDVAQVEWRATERGYGSTFGRDPEALFRVAFSGASALSEELPELKRHIEPLDVEGAPEIPLELTIDPGPEGLSMGINHLPYADFAPLEARVGATQVWRLSNFSDFAHPFHLHGYFFQVLDINGEPAYPLAWKDTIDVPVNHTVRIAVRFDDRPGTWMFHCHILDHARLGMMALVRVSP